MSEAFVYLWYIASTKRYYLGVAIGKPYYTHSSTSKELCDIVPHSRNSPLEERKEFWDKYERGEIEGVRYRILPKRFILNVPYLTEDLDDYGKMCEREHVLLKNRFERCWNRYYNKSLGNPLYVDQSGENHHFYGVTGKDNPRFGIPLSEETKKKLSIAHTGKKLTEDHKRKISENHADMSGENNPSWKGGVTNDKEYQLEKNIERYWKNPEESRKKNAAKMRKLRAKWKQDPAWQEKINKQERERRAKFGPRKRVYTREQLDRRAQWARERRAKLKAETGYAIGYSKAKKKTETQGVGTLKAFQK